MELWHCNGDAARGGVHTIDTGFGRPGLVAAYLMESAGRAAFIDVGPASTLARLLEALEARGLGPEAVDWVVLTHVHLDHAGAAGALMARLPRARLLVHPRGARHLIDPSRLIAGAAAVYGEEALRRRFGEILPVPAERVVEAPEGTRIDLGGRVLRVLDTPGHARHHLCLHDPAGSGVFTGDTFGLCYPELDAPEAPFLLPTTTPVQFDPVALHASMDRIAALGAGRAWLTHFGCLAEPARHVHQLHEAVDAMVAMARGCARETPGERRAAAIRARLADWVLERLGGRIDRDRMEALLGMDLTLNAQGLEVWLQRRGEQR